MSFDEFCGNRDIIIISEEKKLIIIGDSMLNGLHEKGLSKNYLTNVNSFPHDTSETALENIDGIIKSKADCVLVHAGTNKLTNITSLLN